MSPKHREYQKKLLEIGEALGYESRRSFRKSAMGDAVWLEPASAKYARALLPVVAFKVLSFETAKEIREALMTLQTISPALGVLVVLEEDYALRARDLKKYDENTYPQHIRRLAERIKRGLELIFRVEVWGQEDVDRLHRENVQEMLPLRRPRGKKDRRRRNAGVRSQKPEARSKKPEARTKHSGAGGQESGLRMKAPRLWVSPDSWILDSGVERGTGVVLLHSGSF